MGSYLAEAAPAKVTAPTLLSI
eukprot:SAG11_NODE_9793_length_880_cov_1.103713_1_plen_21_part_10